MSGGMAPGSSNVVAPAALGAFFLLAGYLNLNDPDWALWSTAYALGGAICGWTVLQAGADRALKDTSSLRRRVALTYGAVCLGLAGHSAFLAPRTESPPGTVDNIVVAFLSSEVARETGGALILTQAMVLCGSIGRRPSGSTATGTGSFAAVSAPAARAAEILVGIVGVAMAVAATLLGIFLPGYLERAGIAVPAHCGGGGD